MQRGLPRTFDFWTIWKYHKDRHFDQLLKLCQFGVRGHLMRKEGKIATIDGLN